MKIYPVLLLLCMSIAASCTNQITSGDQRQIKLESYIESEGEVGNLPSVLIRSGEKAEISVDPNVLFEDNRGLHGYIFDVESDFDNDLIITKGTLSVLHYEGVKAPKLQTVLNFHEVSKSKAKTVIPFHFGFASKETTIINGSVDGSDKIYTMKYINNRPPKKANLVITATEIDRAGKTIE